ncbi:MAG TPA: carboxypeptidase regulatory-like domain-containing protein [Crocinitomicaceae bacterium]|nr:carboxypeptidase regulatory-like domain-containing protein [Crocinitomicaceae bacterium]
MIRRLHLIVLSIFLSATYSFAQGGLGNIKGYVKNAEGKPVDFAKVMIKQGSSTKAVDMTDDEGMFQIMSIEPGDYDIVVESEEYPTFTLEKFKVRGDQTNEANIKLGSAEELGVVRVRAETKLIDPHSANKGILGREDIGNLAPRSPAELVKTQAGVLESEGTGEISIRGSRPEDNYFYIDGIKVRGSSNIPKGAIEEISVFVSGLPASYGDVTGGVISVTTRGPQGQFFGSVEGVTSGFYFKGKDKFGYDGKVFGLDKYGYNLIEGLFAGPLWMQKDSLGNKTKPRLGFLVTAMYNDMLDGRPMGNGGNYRVKKEVRDELLANPLRSDASGTGSYPNAEFLRESDFERVKWRMNARRRVISGTAKLDVATGPRTNLSFGGSMNYNGGSLYGYSNRELWGNSYTNSLFNFNNFAIENRLDWRVYGRFTQRFINNDAKAKIRSFVYTLMVDYSQSSIERYDPKHKFNFFNYGHVGTFIIDRENSYEINFANQSAVHNGFRDKEVYYTPSRINPDLAAYTSQYYNIYDGMATGHYENLTQIQLGNGLINGDVPRAVYNTWNNIGAPFNGFAQTNNQQIRLSGSGTVTAGKHSITLGFEFEQRFDRGFTNGYDQAGSSNGPVGLWTIARQLANFHIRELDLDNPMISIENGLQIINYNRLNSSYAYANNGVYGGQKTGDEQSFFDYNLRKKLGMSGGSSTFVDVDAYDPNMYSLDMFSADELLNSGSSFVSYWGYDHTGKRVKGTTDINKYFNEYDANGNYRRFVGAFQPIYASVFAMDKFEFKNMIFNIGVRADIFDANQPVLKDPYLLYNAYTVGEAKKIAEDMGLTWAKDMPSSIGDDYTIYVNDVNNPTAINGYRSGDTWFNKDGDVVDDPKLIRGSAGIAPWLKDPNNQVVNADAFTKYKPQINIMPRISFAFPISEKALFSAHYDILTKRPTYGLRFDPYEYQFLKNRSAIVNNPNLRPEQTIDYEIGFQQAIGTKSSIKISAYYREQRNVVQMINVQEAYPRTYRTYGNRDFGTVKGIILSYDLRRTGNIRLTANYTLQFAEGTGSNANSASGLINAGQPNLRNIFPYDYDRRHAFAITFDYRYGRGADYNGPSIKDVKLFENMGLNIMTNIYSGSPYSAQTIITDEGHFSPQSAGLSGTTNGSRLPWTYRLDLQIDRTIPILMGKKPSEGEKDNRKKTHLQVYLRITNLLNQMNVINVYRATGNWNDDGYLEAAQYQLAIQSQLDEASYRDFYTMKIQNASNISMPRQIRLGVKFDF